MFVQIQPAVRSQIHIQHLITESPTPTSDINKKYFMNSPREKYLLHIECK